MHFMAIFQSYAVESIAQLYETVASTFVNLNQSEDEVYHANSEIIL